MNWKSFLAGIGAVIVLLLSCFVSYRIGHRNGLSEAIVSSADTLTIHDTISVSEPLFVTTTIIDTVLLQCNNVTYVHDTAYLPMPVEQKEYADTSFRAWVSGIRPQLDSIHIYQSTQVITRNIVEPQRKWGLSFQVGIGPTYGLINRQFDLGIYAGYGVFVYF